MVQPYIIKVQSIFSSSFGSSKSFLSHSANIVLLKPVLLGFALCFVYFDYPVVQFGEIELKVVMCRVSTA